MTDWIGFNDKLVSREIQLKATEPDRELEDRNTWIYIFYTWSIIHWFLSTTLIPMYSKQMWEPSILHRRWKRAKTSINISARVVLGPRESNTINSLGHGNKTDFAINTLTNKNSKWLQTGPRCRDNNVKSNSILTGRYHPHMLWKLIWEGSKLL